jgi:hypothetical protein
VVRCTLPGIAMTGAGCLSGSSGLWGLSAGRRLASPSRGARLGVTGQGFTPTPFSLASQHRGVSEYREWHDRGRTNILGAR